MAVEFEADISRAYWARPTAFIRRTQAGLSERVKKPMSFEMKLLSFLQSAGSGKSGQSAQEENFRERQHFRTPHQLAFSFFAQPGHFPRRHIPQAAQ